MNSMLEGPDFKLGLFAANCSSGSAVTNAPDRWSGSWADNIAAAKIADEVGLDFLLPVARWIGYGGASNYHNDVLDPTTWMAGLLAVTKKINIFSTVHTAFTHPIVAAKQFATADQIGNGRAGINIVAGWNKTEFDAFGIELPLGHDDRYQRAQEWWDVINKIWSTQGRFDHAGKFFNLKGVEGLPKPVNGSIPVINAGSSEQGRDFDASLLTTSSKYTYDEEGPPSSEYYNSRRFEEFILNKGFLILEYFVQNKLCSFILLQLPYISESMMVYVNRKKYPIDVSNSSYPKTNIEKLKVDKTKWI
jgi:hypothetical protein